MEHKSKILNDSTYKELHDLIILKHVLGKKIVIVNIGTDKVIGDSFGPLFGEMISERNYEHIISYGSFDNVFHALNLKGKVDKINEVHKDDFIIGTDATLIDPENPQYLKELTYKKGPIKPGQGVGKSLPPIGDMKITYAVDYTTNGFMFPTNSHKLGDVYKRCRQLVQFFDSIESTIKQLELERCEEVG